MAMNYTIRQKNKPDVRTANGRVTVPEYDEIAKLAAASKMTVPTYVGHLCRMAIENQTVLAVKIVTEIMPK